MSSNRSPEESIARYNDFVARQEANTTDEELYLAALDAAREAAAAGYAPAQHVTACHLFASKRELPLAYGYCCRAALQGHREALAELRDQYRSGGDLARVQIRAHLTPEQIAQLKLAGVPKWLVKLLFTVLCLLCVGAGLYFVGMRHQYLIGVPFLVVAAFCQPKSYLPRMKG